MKALPICLCCLLLPLCTAQLDLEIVILDDKNYNSTKFVEAVAVFYPVIIENGTEIPLLLSRPVVQNIGFSNPVLCVNGTCYKEADLPPPVKPVYTTPAPSGGSNTDLIVIASAVSVTTVVLIVGMYWCLMKRKHTSIASKFHRVVIRESIDLPPHLTSQMVKMGSKHTRGIV